MLQPGEKAKCRLYLGFPDEFRYKNTRLESSFINISDEAIEQVRALLVTLATIDSLIINVGLANAGLKQVDEIHFFGPNGQITQQRKAGRTYVGQLSIILGVPPYADYFGTQGYPGDSFSGLGGRMPNGGGFFNIG